MSFWEAGRILAPPIFHNHATGEGVMQFEAEKRLWEEPDDLLRLDRIREIWSTIDGIEGECGSRRHHQLLIAGRGARLYKPGNIAWLLEEVRRHLDIERSTWRHRRDFLGRFARSFLALHPHRAVYVQLLPRRKTFRILHVDGRRDTPQDVWEPDLQYHAACLGDHPLELEFGIRLDPEGMLMAGVRDGRAASDELWWTKVDVERRLAGERVVETWFCLAYELDSVRLKQVHVPILDRFFDPVNKIQGSPLLSFTAISNSGREAATHCCSLDPHMGTLLDIRQSERSLAYQLGSAPHNHNGLCTLLYGR